MGKRMLSLYVEDNLVEMAKRKFINLSKLFNEMIIMELMDDEEISENQRLTELKLLNSKLTLELREKSIELDKLKNLNQKKKRHTDIRPFEG